MDSHIILPDGALPVSPGMSEEDAQLAMTLPRETATVDTRTVILSVLAIVVGAGAGCLAQLLTTLIALITNVAFYHQLNATPRSPAGAHLGAWVIAITVAGALIVGLMARFGSSAIRGHGIPEVMERVLHGQSRIPIRVMVLKPLSAAVAIGTGGPFGAEGPIIATGAALGSVVGQVVHMSADERKTLLAAGAAAGMAATFGSPISAVLLAVELLLFEYRARSLIPVAMAAATAAVVRIAFRGPGTDFAIGMIAAPHAEALACYAAIGALVGVAAAGVTWATYGVEDLFEHLPIHWAWWPALGALVLGLVGWFDPRVLGIGYENITNIINGQIVGTALALFIAAKFVGWVVYLGSGTSGGTLAPLFTVGGGLGALLGGAAVTLLPSANVDPHIAALVGMAAMFAGASHALLASIVFTFEITRQPMGLLPLLAGGTSAYLVSLLLARNSIMTEKLARRGVRVRAEYTSDHLDQMLVRDVAPANVVSLAARDTLGTARQWIAQHAAGSAHQGFPVVDEAGLLVGVITRRDLLDHDADDAVPLGSLIRRPPVVVYPGSTLREAADQMVRAHVGRLPVVDRSNPRRVVGMITRSDLLGAHASRLEAGVRRQVGLSI